MVRFRVAIVSTFATATLLAFAGCGGAQGLQPLPLDPTEAPGTPTPTVEVAPSSTSSLPAVADQFGRALATKNYAALLPVFTKEGLAAAQTLQAALGSTADNQDAAITGYSVGSPRAEGIGYVLELTLNLGDRQSMLVTQWRSESGQWKVADIKATP